MIEMKSKRYTFVNRKTNTQKALCIMGKFYKVLQFTQSLVLFGFLDPLKAEFLSSFQYKSQH